MNRRGEGLSLSIQDDYQVFDNLQAVTYRYLEDGNNITMDGRQKRNSVDIEIQDALVRMVTDRNIQQQKQLFDKYRSLNISGLSVGDTIIEIPAVQLVHPESEAKIIPKNDDLVVGDLDLRGEKTYFVLAIDNTSLGSRWRVAVRRN